MTAIPSPNRPNYELEWHRLSDLKVHKEAQRELENSWADKIANNFVLDAIGVFIVVEDEHNDRWVLDAQHRLVAARRSGNTDIHVGCAVFRGMSLRDAADLFLHYNNTRTTRPIDKHELAVKAERPVESKADQLAKEAGIQISRHKGNSRLACVTTFHQLVKKSPKAAELTLRFILDAFGNHADAFDKPMIGGVGDVVYQYAVRQRVIDLDALAAKVSSRYSGISAFRKKSDQWRQFGRTIRWGVRHELIDTYNHGRRSQRITEEV